jgi:hypothetical protein
METAIAADEGRELVQVLPPLPVEAGDGDSGQGAPEPGTGPSVEAAADDEMGITPAG